MSSDLIFKIIVSESGKEKYSANLPFETVSNIVSSYPDNKSSNDFFHLAARHSASSVRENVAYKDNLSEEIVELLAADNSISVLRNLVRSSSFRKNASQQLLEKMISLDVEIAQSIANSVESFEQADINELAALLVAHHDPSVALSLASNYSLPKKILKTLLNHYDSSVANEAKSRLED